MFVVFVWDSKHVTKICWLRVREYGEHSLLFHNCWPLHIFGSFFIILENYICLPLIFQDGYLMNSQWIVCFLNETFSPSTWKRGGWFLFLSTGWGVFLTTWWGFLFLFFYLLWGILIFIYLGLFLFLSTCGDDSHFYLFVWVEDSHFYLFGGGFLFLSTEGGFLF